MYIIICETDLQPRFDAQGIQGWYTGMTLRDGMGGRWERGSGWGTRVHLWRIHVDVWQNQYNIVK